MNRVKFIRVNIMKDKEVEEAVEKSVAWTKETGAILGGVVNCAGTGAPSRVSSALLLSSYSQKLRSLTLTI